MLLLQSFASKLLIYGSTLEPGKCQHRKLQQISSFYKEHSRLKQVLGRRILTVLLKENAFVQKEIQRNQDDSIH